MNASQINMAAKAENAQNAAGSAATMANAQPDVPVYDFVTAPDYVSATYYLTVNKVDTDKLKGQDVVNLKGENVGKIDEIIRDKDTQDYYAMIDLSGIPRYNLTGKLVRGRAGVPLNDVLLSTTGDQVMLSTHGEQYLRQADAKVVKNFDVVKNLYTL